MSKHKYDCMDKCLYISKVLCFYSYMLVLFYVYAYKCLYKICTMIST